MGSALCCIDIVYKGENSLRIACVVLESHLYNNTIFFILEVYGLGVEYCFILIEVLHKFLNSTFILKFIHLVASFINKSYLQSFIQEG